MPPAGSQAYVSRPPALAGAPVSAPRVVATYPHDPAAYTQGLVYLGDDTLYEGTGYWESSSLREVALASGQVRREVSLVEVAPPDGDQRAAFGEGIAVVGDQIFQLTWQSGFGLIYDRATFAAQRRFTYPPAGQTAPTQGWGLAYDGSRLIMSDGTATLYFVDPEETFRTGVLAVTGQVAVHDSQGPIAQLNELEFIDGEIYANIYTTDLIARIDPATGQVRSYLDLSGLRDLLPTGPSIHPEVLNGIAYDAAGDRLLVTGKWWPSLFEIDLPVARSYLPLTMVVLPAAIPQIWS
ncbi:MAG: glutaminyl-peptide cyclotransferase [Chloroflexales bacterium]|nr:glutaminyl-peptide cyclotransferase [Chloroflexales bacterium]